MSYDLGIKNKQTRRTVRLTDSCYKDIGIYSFEDYGGTYQIGGTNELDTNMTYNYAPFLVKTLGKKGIRSLYKIKFSLAEKKLDKAIKILKEADQNSEEWTVHYKEPDEKTKKHFKDDLGIDLGAPTGYWACTVPNVLKALEHLKFLMSLAKKLNPNGYDKDFIIDGD